VDLCGDHNPATPRPHSRPNLDRQWSRDKNQKGMGMTESLDHAAAERREIAARIANFKATQEKFRRERAEYFAATLQNAQQPEKPRHTFESPPFWS